MRLINALLSGRSVSVADGAELMDVDVARARELMTNILDELEPAVRDPLSSKLAIRLTGLRYGEPSLEVAVAACLGSALSSLFEGTKYEAGMKQALAYVTNASARPDKFNNLDRKFFFVRAGGEAALPQSAQLLERVASAVLDQRRLRLVYESFEGQMKEYTVEPWSLAIYDHQLYVLGRRVSDDTVRLFRFSRIEDARRTRGSFAYPPPESFDPRTLFRESFGVWLREGEPTEHVLVRLNARWRTYAMAHRWHPSQKTVTTDNGIHVSLDVRMCNELVAWILSFGADAEVLAPARLRDQVRDRALALAELYRERPNARPQSLAPAPAD